jgi:hypothetical protein
MIQEETVGQRPLEVAQDALHGRRMGLPWIVHMQTDLLGGIGDVRLCKGQVLQSPYNALKLGNWKPCKGSVPPTVAAAQTGADAPAAGSTEIVAFTGGTTLPPRTGTMVTMGSGPLSGTSVPAAGGLPSPKPTTSSGPR